MSTKSIENPNLAQDFSLTSWISSNQAKSWLLGVPGSFGNQELWEAVARRAQLSPRQMVPHQPQAMNSQGRLTPQFWSLQNGASSRKHNEWEVFTYLRNPINSIGDGIFTDPVLDDHHA